MKSITLTVLGSLLALTCAKAIPENLLLREGDTVPSMEFLADTGSSVKTESFAGQWTVLYFYPMDDTPGCTTQAKTFSSLLDDFTQVNAVVYGINTDSIESHKKFKKKYDLKVTLLSDPEGKTAGRFGIRVLAGMCARDSVLINPERKVEQIYRGVNPAGNPVEILKAIQSRQM